MLWHAPAHHQSAVYYHFTPSHSGARVQRITKAVAEVEQSRTQIFLSIDQHLECSRMWHAPDAVASAVQLLLCEERVYYAVDGVVPFMPLAFRYLDWCCACSCWPQISSGSSQVSCRWPQAVVAASPNADDFRRSLCAPPSTVVPITLPLWQQDKVLDLRRVAHAGMTERQVRKSWQLLHPW